MAAGQPRFTTQRGNYRGVITMYQRPSGTQSTPSPPPYSSYPPPHSSFPPPGGMVHKSESVISLSISGPVPPMGFPQGGRTMCAPRMMGWSASDPPEPRPASPMMPPTTSKRVYMSTPLAEPPSTAAYERPMYYGRPCSPPPPAGPTRPSSDRQVPIQSAKHYDKGSIRTDNYDDSYAERSLGSTRRPSLRNHNYEGGIRTDDYDDNFAERSHGRTRTPSLRSCRSTRDTTGREIAGKVTSALSRSGSRVLRFEHELSEASSAGRAVGSGSRSDVRRCRCRCGVARTASRGQVLGICIKPKREEVEEMYVLKKKKGSKKKEKPASPPPAQPGIFSYLRGLVGLAAEEAPAQKSAGAGSNTDDEDDYEVTRLDRAELERLCRQMNVQISGDREKE